VLLLKEIKDKLPKEFFSFAKSYLELHFDDINSLEIQKAINNFVRATHYVDESVSHGETTLSISIFFTDKNKTAIDIIYEDIDDEDINVDIDCTCGYYDKFGSECNHVAASLKLLGKAEEITNSGTSSEAKKVSTKESKYSGKSIYGNKVNINEKAAIINNLKRKLGNQVLNYRLGEPTCEFVEDTLEIKLNYAENYFYSLSSSGHYLQLTAKRNIGELDILCGACEGNKTQQCHHLATMINHSLVQDYLASFQLDEISFEKLLLKAQPSFKRFDLDDAKKHFKIVYSTKGIKLLGRNFALLKPSDSPFLLDKPPVVLETEEMLLDSLTKNSTERTGIIWDSNDKISLIVGKPHKSLNQLISISKSDRIIGHDVRSKDFINKLLGYIKSNEKVEIITNYLKESIGALAEIPKYISTLKLYDYSPAIKKSDLVSFEFSDSYIEMIVDVEEDDLFISINFHLYADGELIPFEKVSLYNVYFMMVDDRAYFYKNSNMLELFKAYRNAPVQKALQIDSIRTYQFLSEINPMAKINIKGFRKEELTDLKKQIHIREVGTFIVFEPTLVNDVNRISPFDKVEIFDSGKKIIYSVNETFCNEFIEEVRNLHPDWDVLFVPQKYFHLTGQEFTKNLWFMEFYENAKMLGIEIYGQEKLSKLKFNANKPSIRTKIASGIDWFDASIEMKYGDLSVSYSEWFEAIKNNEKYIKLSDGSMGVLPEAWLKKLQKLVSIAERKGETLQISKLKFNVIDDFFDNIDDEAIKQELMSKRTALENYEQNKNYILPKNVNAILRPYQLQGYQWLKFLDEYNFGGCLADDMGLGKTLQVICLLADQKLAKRGTNLVVVPKSLMFNWAAEIDKFAPHLSYHIYHGLTRDKNHEAFSSYDIVISTYDTVARDIEDIKNIVFNYIILDESQAIKNVQAQRYKAMRLLQSRNKIVMTGTPIENNTFDLYAQLSFANPGLLGSQKSFADNFSTAIDVHASIDALQTLKKLIHPFLLRRTKEVVAKDLPDKTESVIFCEMGAEQRKLYDALKEKIKKDITEKIEESGIQNSKFKILEGLLRLRQLCNAPELVDNTLPEKKKESVKLDTLITQLTEEIGDHKALVFSQFVTMLDLIKRELDARNVKYAYLDGSTVDRGSAVNDFMDNEECNIFLLSLKAGNTGLNLTKADYVYIVDPWWNPAVEAQAIDRTHRIGQDKNIFAYKLICKDTIEEKIVQLQSKKKKLAQDLIQADENIFKSLSKDELMSLFD
jgi:hypothetical protein